MFSSSLLTGLGISGVSTGVYAAFTSEYKKINIKIVKKIFMYFV